MSDSLWDQCLHRLQGELTPQQFNTWIRPLHAEYDSHTLRLLAPNAFVKERVENNFMTQIAAIACDLAGLSVPIVTEVGTQAPPDMALATDDPTPAASNPPTPARSATVTAQPVSSRNTSLNPNFTFDNFVEGKSNQLGKAASFQVGENPGKAYNPLLIYGGVGLGKTHLMHAVGNMIVQQKPKANVIYLHSERFVAEMVKALQHNTINNFKRFYRSVDALLIDDIQFFAGKERSQEEFFHTFNSLLEGGQQVVMTCDRYPKEVDGLEERLKSRFGWGLPVAIEAPELETRVAILMSKAQLSGSRCPAKWPFSSPSGFVPTFANWRAHCAESSPTPTLPAGRSPWILPRTRSGICWQSRTS